VKFFNSDRGYGFIRPDDGIPDIFAHISAFQAAGLREPHESDRLSFDAEPGRAGKLQAVNLKFVA